MNGIEELKICMNNYIQTNGIEELVEIICIN